MLCSAEPRRSPLRSPFPGRTAKRYRQATASGAGKPLHLPPLRNRPRNLRPSAASGALQHGQARKVKRGSSDCAQGSWQGRGPGAARQGPTSGRHGSGQRGPRGAPAVAAHGPHSPAPSAPRRPMRGGRRRWAGPGWAGRVRVAAALSPSAPACPPLCGAAPGAALRCLRASVSPRACVRGRVRVCRRGLACRAREGLRRGRADSREAGLSAGSGGGGVGVEEPSGAGYWSGGREVSHGGCARRGSPHGKALSGGHSGCRSRAGRSTWASRVLVAALERRLC